MAVAEVSKMEAVRQALSGLGKNAKPGSIVEFIKKTYEIDMTTGHVSSYKSAILREKSPKKSAAPKVASTPATAAPGKAAPVAAKTPKAESGDGVSLEDVQTVKLLIGRVGEGNLKSLIGLLG